MESKTLISALRHLKVETGSLACSGCGREHNCSTHGCAIIREAADLIEQLLADRAGLIADIRNGVECCEFCSRTLQGFQCESDCDKCEKECPCKDCDKTFSNFEWRGIIPDSNESKPDEEISRETYKLRVCFEANVCMDPNEGSFPVGLQLRIPDAKRQVPYDELTRGLDPMVVIREFGLEEILRPEDVRVITPDEFDERYGTDDDDGEEGEESDDEDEG